MSNGIVFEDRQVNVIVMAVLVQKLGGTAVITQDDIDRIAFARLMEDVMPDGSIQLRLERTKGGAA